MTKGGGEGKRLVMRDAERRRKRILFSLEREVEEDKALFLFSS